MGFLTPWFLAGIAAVGLPVYVHLLRQYKQTPVKFSSLMFFERRTQSSIKHRRLKYLLLFALRCLFVALLVLAFARPYVHSSAIANVNKGKTVVFAIDNSLSMRQADRFAKAKQQALEEIARLKDGDRGQVVTFGGPAKLVTDMTGDRQALRAAVSALEAGDDASSYAELARVLRSTNEGYKTDIEAHAFTDLQKSSMPASFSDLHLNDGTKLTVHNTSDGAIPNWAVEAVDAPRRVFDTKKVRTLATIAGYGSDAATRSVSLVANGKTVETKQVKVPPGGRATAEFLTLDVPYGLTKCEVRIDGADKFPQDDHWFFSVERADPKPALLIHSPNDAASPLYVKTALESATDAAFTLDSRTPDQAANVELPKYAFAILSDAGPLPRKLEESLEKFVQGGGSILIALGRYATPGRNIPVAGFPVTQIHTITGDSEPVQTVAQIDSSYPSFSVGAARATGTWDGVQIFQYVKLQTPPESPETRVAARLANGLPLFVDRKIGEGHALVFASAFDNLANNLPLQPVWLSFLEQTTHEMGGVGSGRGAYRVGSFVELRSVKEKNIPVEIIGPDGKRLLTLSESAKASTFQFPSEGFFEIRRANGRQELAAVNPDRRESDFSVVPPETVELWKNTGIASRTTAATAAGLNTRDVNSELWWWVLALLAMLAVAESILGNRHLAGKETA
ncbi:MAG TPA: BatA and WFA domain-containing protein [Bryobacteraceae bacterium]|nr:BatA and WFA domain-containing protein [Bryobacteraceae bacterium]